MNHLPASKNIVVYADDDPDDLEMIEAAFRQFARNVEMVTFQSGRQALSYLKNLSVADTLPCLIILDINMPALNGKELLLHLRQTALYEQTPVVLFTTSSRSADKHFAQQHNAGLVTKPMGFEQLEIIIRQMIDHCTEEVRKLLGR